MKQILTLIFTLLSYNVFAQSVVVNPDGTHSIIIDNGSTKTIVNPNGTHSIIIDNGSTKTIVNPNRTRTKKIKKTTANIGLAKNRRTEFCRTFVFAILLQFQQTNQHLAGKRSINI